MVCSATESAFAPGVIFTLMSLSASAAMSKWSVPMPARSMCLRFLAFEMIFLSMEILLFIISMW